MEDLALTSWVGERTVWFSTNLHLVNLHSCLQSMGTISVFSTPCGFCEHFVFYLQEISGFPSTASWIASRSWFSFWRAVCLCSTSCLSCRPVLQRQSGAITFALLSFTEVTECHCQNDYILINANLAWPQSWEIDINRNYECSAPLRIRSQTSEWVHTFLHCAEVMSQNPLCFACVWGVGF